MAPFCVNRLCVVVSLSWLVAGPGSGLSEEPALGCESVTLELESFPCCPPGPSASGSRCG
jgi:hypothetical protein